MNEPDQNLEVDMDLDAFFSIDTIIAAVETEDEVGCVLRMHLLIEQLLSFYLSEKRQGEMKTYVREPREFSQKLGLATAFGLPLPIAAVAHHINSIRNKIAHRIGEPLGQGDVQQLTRVVNRMSTIDGQFTDVERRSITVPGKNSGNPMVYGAHGVRNDFLISSLAFWVATTQWSLRAAIFSRTGWRPQAEDSPKA